MGDLLQPWHLIVLIGIIILIANRKGLMALATPTQSHSHNPNQLGSDPMLPELKFCTECGQQIKRQAEICPLCGCRQSGM
jgi:hypothetical protein